MSIKNKYITILSLACMMITASCDTEVELCYDEVHPHLAKVEVVYDWEGDLGRHQRPDSMAIFAYRIIRSWECCYQTTSHDINEIKEKGINKGVYLLDSKPDNYEDWAKYFTPATGTVSEHDSDSTEMRLADTFLLKEGEYRFLTFDFENNCPAHKYSYSSLQSMASAVKGNRLTVEYRTYNLNELKEGIKDKYKKDWHDFNPYSKYIHYEARPIFYYHTDEMHGISKEKEVNNIVMRPSCVTQDIVFNFDIKAIKVDSLKVLAEISGIPEKMNIMTEELYTNRTYKMVFPVVNHATATNDDETTMSYRGEISVMGLLANSAPQSITGPGILQLAIYTYTHNDAGEEKSKLYNVGINLYNTIKKYKETHTPDRPCKNNLNYNIIHRYMLPVELNIESPITIDYEEIQSNTDKDANIDAWVIYNEKTGTDL